jgi:gamma-glutamyltranspeptidase/glutathione hydrolase
MPHADNLPFQSRRAPLLATGGMVATAQPLAATAGVEILRAGGNAADAAVATAAALAVVEPTSTGLGGDCFALFYEASTQEVHAVNGSGRAPAALTIDALAERGISGSFGPGPESRPHVVTVPGTAAGWHDTLERHGRMGLAEVLQPAIRIAEDGYPVTPLIAVYWDEQMPLLEAGPNGNELMIDGHAPRPGEIFHNPGMAKVLRTIAEGGPDAFYGGDAGRAIVDVLSSLGGLMTLEDLANHHSTFEPPISTTYRGMNVYECAPNGQGLTVLMALNILEGFDMASMDRQSPEYWHTLIEAMRLAFADSRYFVADPSKTDVPVQALLSAEYADRRRALIDTSMARPAQVHGDVARIAEPVASGSDTVYLTAADGDGNACSFINSNFAGFGTGIVPRGFGFSMQNRGAGFSLDPDHPNALAGGKRPYHTIIPAMTTYSDGALHASFGVKGGFMQPPGHVHMLVNMLDHGMDPQAALDAPRLALRPGTADGAVHLEPEIAVETMSALARMGHDVVPSTDRFSFGTGHAIVRDRETGVLWGGADPRADGAAVGF